MKCNVEGCEEDRLYDNQCDEHLAEAYARDKTIPLAARVADKVHQILEANGAECFDLADGVPLCLAVSFYLDQAHHLKED